MSGENAKDRRQSNLDFKIMAFSFKVRDIFRPRTRIVEDAGIKTCFQVLDFGCGPGSYVMPVISLIGNIGTLYALDVNPLAIESVKKLASKNKIANIRAILSDCDTGLPPASIDVVLLYDTLHDLADRAAVLAELHRVLKADGILSVSDHHLKENRIIEEITGEGLFNLKLKGKSTISFTKSRG